MSTEDELRGQPSRPVSRVQVCLCGLWQHNLCACVFDPGFEDSGWICVFVCIRRRKHLGGLFLQKWWNRTFFSTFLCVCMTPCATLSSTLLSLFTLEFPFFFSFSHLLIFTPLPLLSGLHFLSCACLTLFFYTHHTVLIFIFFIWLLFQALTFFSPQINMPYSSWASHSPLTSSSEGVSMLLPHHQAAAPALPLDQSCLPEESASATRAHNNQCRHNNNNNNNSHHSSSTFSNTIPEFMDSVIDSVSVFT